MGNVRSKDNTNKSEKSDDLIDENDKVSQLEAKESQTSKVNRSQEIIYESSKFAHNIAADKHQYQQQHSKQASLWSLASLNWSYTISKSKSNSLKKQYRHRSSYRSLNIGQQQQLPQKCRSKTYWPKPVTNSIFNSHFKDSYHRNQEFYIEKLIAKGAFGVVFKVILKSPSTTKINGVEFEGAASILTEPVYALKILKKSKVIAENSVQQIKDEADIQKVCSHNPFIVKQIDLWQNRYNLHILTEYMPNGELFSNIQYFCLDLIRIYLAEIALALDFLHNAGIIYRDVKPENILLTHDYHLKLTDFGLSKWLKIGESTQTMCGTLQYTAPEILKGLPYTHAVDWWSLGIVVYEMFMQKMMDPRELLTSINNNSTENGILNLANINTLPHEGQDVLERLLKIDPKYRIRSVRALQRIAMYKNFPIETDIVLKMSPREFINSGDAVNSIIPKEFNAF